MSIFYSFFQHIGMVREKGYSQLNFDTFEWIIITDHIRWGCRNRKLAATLSPTCHRLFGLLIHSTAADQLVLLFYTDFLQWLSLLWSSTF